MSDLEKLTGVRALPSDRATHERSPSARSSPTVGIPSADVIRHPFTLALMCKQSEMRRALRRARGWLNMIAQDRPDTSDIHRVLAEVDAAIAIEADRPGREAGPVRKHESAGRNGIAQPSGHRGGSS